ncbi:hypothetical protein AAG570_007760, partial [Ranatra chinensis]
RNQYDSDVTVWSPQGRLHQVEYAIEAVKLGSAAVGLKNETYAVLIALKRASSDLSSHQKKIIPIDNHIGISISGLTADARHLSRFMRGQCQVYTYHHDEAISVCRLMTSVAQRLQHGTQRYDRRPVGVGLLVAGYDAQGPHIYNACPSANVFDCRAMAIGSRSQSARTYLEKHLSSLKTCSTEELILKGLRALRDTLTTESELSPKNVDIGIVGKDFPFRILTIEETGTFLGKIAGEERRGGVPPPPPPSDPPGSDAAKEETNEVELIDDATPQPSSDEIEMVSQ